MKQGSSKRKCLRCGASFSNIADYEKHLDTCNADTVGKKSEMVSERLKQVSEEFK